MTRNAAEAWKEYKRHMIDYDAGPELVAAVKQAFIDGYHEGQKDRTGYDEAMMREHGPDLIRER